MIDLLSRLLAEALIPLKPPLTVQQHMKYLVLRRSGPWSGCPSSAVPGWFFSLLSSVVLKISTYQPFPSLPQVLCLLKHNTSMTWESQHKLFKFSLAELFYSLLYPQSGDLMSSPWWLSAVSQAGPPSGPVSGVAGGACESEVCVRDVGCDRSVAAHLGQDEMRRWIRLRGAAAQHNERQNSS